MTILTEDELKVWAINKSKIVANTKIDIHGITSRILIENKSDFLALQERIQDKIMYYYYQYTHKGHYYVEDIEDAMRECQTILKDKVREKLVDHNRQIEQIDFNKPCSLMLYYIDNGYIVYNWESAYYLGKLPLKTANPGLFYEKQVQDSQSKN
ncbi:hypothetical protein [Alkalicoccobacillus murimartini]|uniref:Phage protein n=1 Tax=Alkalicoccobacillus murimartini TaxID=171685 RepID=A0ABT9YGM8_9BACI|nr:hypothetical protein [Alkalicoccobacillus murimartini]MDQ0206367.1 hypothetical protein [Alkalicoccobacillus murimartini]